LSLNVQSDVYGRPDFDSYDDTPYGSKTVYLEEVGVQDAVLLSQGFGQNRKDTTLFVPKAQMAFFSHPSSFIGLGINGQFVLHESKSTLNHLYIKFSGTLNTLII
jgi:hypothetical protein